MERLSQREWIAIASHRLSYRWRHIRAEQLDEVAAQLYRDEALRDLEPDEAVSSWLAPLEAVSPQGGQGEP